MVNFSPPALVIKILAFNETPPSPATTAVCSISLIFSPEIFTLSLAVISVFKISFLTELFKVLYETPAPIAPRPADPDPNTLLKSTSFIEEMSTVFPEILALLILVNTLLDKLFTSTVPEIPAPRPATPAEIALALTSNLLLACTFILFPAVKSFLELLLISTPVSSLLFTTVTPAPTPKLFPPPREKAPALTCPLWLASKLISLSDVIL